MDNDPNNQATPPTTPPAQTTDNGTTPPVATPSNGDGGATNDEIVTLKKSDYNNLISQRDKGNASNNFVEQLAQERHIDDFLKSNADKFPDLTRDDLMHVSDPDDLQDAAATMQRRLEEHAQAKLLDLTRADQPQMTPDERAAELKKLQDNPKSDSFDRMLELRLTK